MSAFTKLSGRHEPAYPVGTMLFLGPPVGKDARDRGGRGVLHGDPNAIVKRRCAEFHTRMNCEAHRSLRDTGASRDSRSDAGKPDRMHTDDLKLSLILFDEMRKHQTVCGSCCWVFWTKRVDPWRHRRVVSPSAWYPDVYLGAREMSELISVVLALLRKVRRIPRYRVDQKIYRTHRSGPRKFSPDFMNA